jgi:hypothetical protein
MAQAGGTMVGVGGGLQPGMTSWQQQPHAPSGVQMGQPVMGHPAASPYYPPTATAHSNSGYSQAQYPSSQYPPVGPQGTMTQPPPVAQM